MIDTPIPELSTPEYRKFGLMFGAIIVGLFGLFFPWIFGASWPAWPWVVAVVFWLWALLAPATLRLFYYPWMKFALVLGFINTRIILSVLFLLIFVPVSLFFRLFRIDPLKRTVYDGQIESYWDNSKSSSRNDMENTY